MSGPHHAHASLDGLVTGDAFGDSWFTRSDEPAEALWAAREPRPAPWPWTDDSAMAFVPFAHLTAHVILNADACSQSLAVPLVLSRDYSLAPLRAPPQLGLGLQEPVSWRARAEQREVAPIADRSSRFDERLHRGPRERASDADP